jgi:hypothetical protein
MILSALGQPLVVAATLGAAFLNYLLFFHTELRSHLGILKKGVVGFSGAPKRITAASSTVETLHRCDACGRTEVSHPDIDFRVTADGREFCREHLPAKS